MFDELSKIAAVRKPVKMYRRMLQGFHEASKSVQKGDPHGLSRNGLALHGTDDLHGIVDSGRIRASPLGETGQHGAGVYWWKGFPRESNLKGLQDEGIATPLRSLPDKRPHTRNEKGGHFNLHAQVTGPGDYKLRPKDTAVVDMASRAKNKSLAPLLADTAQKRVRVTDSSLFHRARQQMVASNMRKPLPGPSKQDLLKLFKSRLAGSLQ
jgi:hypothetical protein